MIVLGAAAWVVLWSTVRPRAAYDTLWYTRIALEYAGQPTDGVTAGSWHVFSEYADPSQVAYVAENHGWPYLSPPRLWQGLYYERPFLPAVIAAFVPVLGDEAPIAASLLAVLVFTLAVGLFLRPLVGAPIVAALLVISFANVLFSRWLIFLTTDGLAIAAWTTSLVIAGHYVASGRARWLAALLGVAMALALTRSTASILPLVLGAPAVVAIVARRGLWRRFVTLAVVAGVPLVVFSVIAQAQGWPSFADMLQDLPTQHYHLPPVPNPLSFLATQDVSNVRAMAHTLRHEPGIVILGVLGAAGLLLDRRPWTWPFLFALLIIPITQLLHPAIEEAGRTLSPMWLSVDLGLALLLVRLLSAATRRWRPRFPRGARAQAATPSGFSTSAHNAIRRSSVWISDLP